MENGSRQVPLASRRGEMPNVPGAISTAFGFYARFVVDASGRIVPAMPDARGRT